LINLQKKNLNNKKIKWIKDLNKMNFYPTIYIANEFFDAMPIKQFFKKKEKWFERFVDLQNLRNAKFIEKLTDIRKIERILKFKVSKNQNIIEYSPKTFEYLNNILNKIEKNNGGILIIDYGYLSSKMKESLQAVRNHKYSNILINIGDSDITYNINFNLLKNFTKQFGNLNAIITNQKKFLTSMGILQRAEIVSKNMLFSKKTDLFYRIKRLIDKKQMGELFKVMLIKDKKNLFDTGFKID
jgi:cyclopropane-fatty-acyl-phospholipid synthase